MKFLFIGPGYPGFGSPAAGSGIGTYMREIASGLISLGHECHVLVWSQDKHPHRETLDGVVLWAHPRGYWPLIERFAPESRNVFCRTRVAGRLDRQHRYDWIEVQNDEGIDIGVQRRFPRKVSLRAHTTLAQMIEHKRTAPTRGASANLSRERRAVQMAAHIATHSELHARELRHLFGETLPVSVIPHGIEPPPLDREPAPSSGPPQFLVVGSADQRKGFDRLRPVIEAYGSRYGACRFIIVSRGDPAVLSRDFRLMPPFCGRNDVELVWKSDLTDAELRATYQRSTAFLHVARYESFGLPLLEAAMNRIPVVTTPVGIAEELLRGDLRSYLVNGDDPRLCAQMLEAARSNRDAIGAELRHVAEHSFSRRAMTSAFLAAIKTWRCSASTDHTEVKAEEGQDAAT